MAFKPISQQVPGYPDPHANQGTPPPSTNWFNRATSPAGTPVSSPNWFNNMTGQPPAPQWKNTGRDAAGNRVLQTDYKPTGRAPGAAAPGQQPTSPYGTQSGPGILESYAFQRAMGTDPGYEYAMNRGMNDIDSRMAAGGSYNSGARGMQLSDFAANMGAQRQAQIDSLMGGASAEHLRRNEDVFNQGMGLASGQSGINSAYDLGALGSLDKANEAMIGLGIGKAGVDQKSSQGLINNLLGAYTAYKA